MHVAPVFALLASLVSPPHAGGARLARGGGGRAPIAARLLASADPFRPARPPLAPMAINAVQELLRGDDAAAVAERAVAARAADPDYALAADEEALLRQRVARVAASQAALLALLEAAVAATPWVAKFGASKDFGIGPEADPYVRACRAECMLAALVLHVEGAAVDFVDDDRLEVLRDAPSEAVAALRKAAGGER